MRLLQVLAILTAMIAGCGTDNSNGPSRVIGLDVNCPEFGESSRCTAFAGLSNGEQDVTGLAQWSTSNQTIASVNSTGLVTARVAGEVAIRASYQGVTAFKTVWAVPGQGLHGTSRTLEGMVLSLRGPLSDVVMAILNGPNAGRTTTTSSNGRFFMDRLQDGQFTIRLSRPGYRTAEYQWWIPGGRERIPTLTAE